MVFYYLDSKTAVMNAAILNINSLASLIDAILQNPPSQLSDYTVI
ncbi:hypothetical protein FQV37_1368 [Psychrobacter nivimaris]|uniref:Uncharacterized protein n=1 Tax=Psychrobacter nivimaris TaxID=281738 RepID=A0A6N7BWU5_9GAMM|nr:hypothetical protein FQV37_1368 [Psychrobacter nivimaris]